MNRSELTPAQLLASSHDSLNRLRLAEPSWSASERERGIKNMAVLTAQIETLQAVEGKKR